MALSIWSFVAAHGALELPSIFISGGAGLRLASTAVSRDVAAEGMLLAQAGGESNPATGGDRAHARGCRNSLRRFSAGRAASVALKFSVGAVLLTGLCLWLSGGWARKGHAAPVAVEELSVSAGS